MIDNVYRIKGRAYKTGEDVVLAGIVIGRAYYDSWKNEQSSYFLTDVLLSVDRYGPYSYLFAQHEQTWSNGKIPLVGPTGPTGPTAQMMCAHPKDRRMQHMTLGVICSTCGTVMEPAAPEHTTHDCVPASIHEALDGRFAEAVKRGDEAMTRAWKAEQEVRKLNEELLEIKRAVNYKGQTDVIGKNLELMKRVKMLEAERGPGIKHEPDEPLPCDIDWD